MISLCYNVTLGSIRKCGATLVDVKVMGPLGKSGWQCFYAVPRGTSTLCIIEQEIGKAKTWLILPWHFKKLKQLNLETPSAFHCGVQDYPELVDSNDSLDSPK